MNTRIEFGGFYGSIHEHLIEHAVEGFYGDDYLDDEGFEPKWDTYFNNYMREWTELFEMWLKDEYGLDIKFTELKLWSPQFYNFRTDEIDASITTREVGDILDKFSNDREVDEYIRQAVQSRDGFISFYDYDQAIANKDDVLPQFILRYLAEKFNDNEMMNYYDRHNSYERIL